MQAEPVRARVDKYQWRRPAAGALCGAMDMLVTPDWLAWHLEAPDLVILDCSVRTEVTEAGIVNSSGRAAFDQGHIPGAGFADLKGDLSDPGNPVEFSLPAPEVFCAAMGRLGVGDGMRVVLYDTSFSAWAARVWWMLRWVGFDNAALLDGGLAGWRAAGQAISTAPPDLPVRTLTPRPRPGVIADRQEVLAAVGSRDVTLVDTLPAEIFAGEVAMYARPGHIPTAVNVPGPAMLDEAGRFLPLEDLERMYAMDKKGRAITYCGGGILASLGAFAMTRLGYEDVAVYTASLQEWAADPSCPMTVAAG